MNSPTASIPQTPIVSQSPDAFLEFPVFDCGTLPAAVRLSRFKGRSGVREIHLMVRPTEYGNVADQLGWVSRAYRRALEFLNIEPETAVLRRFFCSDLSNQAAALEACPVSNPRNPDVPCAISWVRQPPVPPVKVALWAYHIVDSGTRPSAVLEDHTLTLPRGELAHHWTTGLTCPAADTSHSQTWSLFEKYDAFLRDRSLTMADNVIRTWLFVRNIDANYAGLVTARREFFARRGLTPKTHFIASTGIEGAHADVAAKVTLDAYAISGIRSEQIEFLAATDHLSPTHVYGVTFERGTSVSYRDRKHVFISGTASIDRQGAIVHPGDVSRQLDRTLENMEALLRRAGATLADMGHFVVYVRDPSDSDVAWGRMRERFGAAPIEVVTAAVCRPGWLIEVEGMAAIPASNPALPEF